MFLFVSARLALDQLSETDYLSSERPVGFALFVSETDRSFMTKSREVGLTSFDCLPDAVDRGPVLLKPPVDVLSVFYGPGDYGAFQNQLPIRFRVRLFDPLSVFMDNPVLCFVKLFACKMNLRISGSQHKANRDF
ncbi:hypothetical protein L596_017661 [Steinernema carpocapsae]|uniref:Uncharacterized protein n=1 Tax=Steinernema carpocapsae TaxID=34508 RepID=A0A4U5N2N1_STECR|nr:hypothetical protein L596_017661 [Steinernema carpocapsae]